MSNLLRQLKIWTSMGYIDPLTNRKETKKKKNEKEI